MALTRGGCFFRGALIVTLVALGSSAIAQGAADAEAKRETRVAFPQLHASLPELPASFRLVDVRHPSDGAVELSLERFEVFAPDAELVVVDQKGRTRALPIPDVAYFSGTITGQPDSRVYLSVAGDGGITGLIQDDAGRLSAPEMAADDPTLRLRPVEPDSDEDRPPFTCDQARLPALNDAAALAQGAAAGEPAEVLAGTVYRALLAVETDFEYRQKFPTSAAALAYIGELVGYASTIYRREVATQLQVSFARVWETSADPWAQTSPACALFEFGKYWNDNMTGQSRSAAHMLSGKSSGGGVAWLSALCVAPQNYNIGSSCPGMASSSNYAGDYGYTGAITGNFNSATPTSMWDIVGFSHEVGHNFSSPHTHCYNGIGGNSSPVDQCYGQEAGCYSGARSLPGPVGQGSGTIMSYCHLLSGGFTNVSLTFGGEPGVVHPYGVLPLRVPTQMRDYVVAVAGAAPSCLPVMTGFTVGGSISGLTAGQSVVLRNTATFENLARGNDGSFTFETIQPTSASYNVIVQTQPAGQTCTVSNGSGTIGDGDVTDVAISCAVDPTPTPTPTWTSSFAPTTTPTGGGCAASVTTVGSANVNSGTAGTALTVTVGAAGVPAGNSIMVGFTMDQTAGAVSCSDSAGNAYTVEVDRNNGSDLHMVMCAAYNVAALAAGQTVQVNHPNTSSARNMTVQHISGLTAAPLDRKASTTGTGTAPSSGLTAATTQADEVLYGVIGHRGNTVDFTAGAGYTLAAASGSTTTANRSTEAELRIVSAAGQYAATGTLNPSRNWAAGIVTLKCAGGGTVNALTPTETVNTPTPAGTHTDTPTPTPTWPPSYTPTTTPTGGGGCSASVTTVGSANVNSGTAGTALTVTVGAGGVPAGTSIMVGFTLDQTAGAVSCSDSAGNAYTVEVDRNNGNDLHMVMCAAYNVAALAAGQTVQVSHPNTSSARNMTVQHISGLAAAPLDRKASTTGTGTAPSSGLTAVTAQADEVLYGVIGHRGNTVDFTAGAGYSLAAASGSTTTTNRSTEAEVRIVSAAGQYAATGTLNPSRNWAAGVVTLKCAGGGPVNTPTPTETVTTPTPAGTHTDTPTPTPTGITPPVGGCSAASVTTVGSANINNGTVGTALTVTVGPGGVPAGNSIMVGFTMDQTAGAVSCSDGAGNAYTVEVDRNNGSDLRMVICAAYNVAPLAAGQIVQVTHPNVSSARNMTVQTISGLAAAPLDRKVSNSGAGTAPSSGLSALTTHADEVLYGVIGHRGQAVDFTAGTGFTLTGPVGSTTSANRSTEAEFRMVTAIGQYATTGTLNPARNWAAGILTLRCN